MAFLNQISPSQSLFNKTHIRIPTSFANPNANLQSSFISKTPSFSVHYRISSLDIKRTVTKVVSSVTAEKPKKFPGETKGFVDELRFVTMKLHSRDQAKEGEQETKHPEERPMTEWEPTLVGYLKFLVNNKLVYESLDRIIAKALFPSYAEFSNTGLERSEALAKDLEWFKELGYAIPEPSVGITYSRYLEELSENDPQAFVCHFYNINFAHTAGGRMFGKKNVRDKLNKVAESWSREEKDHCLEETKISFQYNAEKIRLILICDSDDDDNGNDDDDDNGNVDDDDNGNEDDDDDNGNDDDHDDNGNDDDHGDNGNEDDHDDNGNDDDDFNDNGDEDDAGR